MNTHYGELLLRFLVWVSMVTKELSTFLPFIHTLTLYNTDLTFTITKEARHYFMNSKSSNNARLWERHLQGKNIHKLRGKHIHIKQGVTESQSKDEGSVRRSTRNEGLHTHTHTDTMRQRKSHRSTLTAGWHVLSVAPHLQRVVELTHLEECLHCQTVGIVWQEDLLHLILLEQLHIAGPRLLGWRQNEFSFNALSSVWMNLTVIFFGN